MGNFAKSLDGGIPFVVDLLNIEIGASAVRFKCALHSVMAEAILT